MVYYKVNKYASLLYDNHRADYKQFEHVESHQANYKHKKS